MNSKGSFYRDITIENFRSIERIKIENLTNINLFFGGNNCGKTSILEAVFAHASGFNAGAFFNVVLPKRTQGDYFGVYDMGETITHLFRIGANSFEKMNFSIYTTDYNNEKKQITYEFNPSNILDDLNLNQFTDINMLNHYNYENQLGKNNNNPNYLGDLKISDGQKIKRLSINRNLDFPADKVFKGAIYSDILEHRNLSSSMTDFSGVKRSNTLKTFIEEMKDVFPEIDDIEVIPFRNNASNLYFDVNGKKIPISLFGDGMRRWFYLIGSLITYRNSVHLIEEIDTTFHPESIPMLTKSLYKYSELYNNQIFMTSHNQEFLKIMLDTFKDDRGFLENKIRIYTLKKINGGIKLISLNGIEARKSIEDYDLELR